MNNRKKRFVTGLLIINFCNMLKFKMVNMNSHKQKFNTVSKSINKIDCKKLNHVPTNYS